MLVVDDEARIRQLLELVLKDMGCEVILSANGTEALEVLRRRHVDLMLLDLKMPVLDGYETLRRMRGDPRCGSVPVLVVTALLHPSKSLGELPGPVAGHLTKPFDLDALEGTVRAALRQEGRTLPGDPPDDQ